MEKQRIEYIDYLKGFSILLVVIGHFVSRNFTIAGAETRYQLFDFIYSFHMPLFMFLGGYTAYYSLSKPGTDFGRFILKRTLSLLIPYFIWSLFIGNFLSGNFKIELSYLKETLNLLTIEYRGLWFLPTIWFLSIILVSHETILKKIQKNNLLIKSLFLSIITLSILLVIYKLTNLKFIQSAISYYIPFYIGVMLVKFDVIKKLFDKTSIITICCFVFLICGLSFTEGKHDMYNSIMRLSAGVTSLPVFFYLFKNNSLPDKVKQQLSFFGKNTLVIYIVSGSMLSTGITIDNLSPFWMFFTNLLFSIIICNACSIISRIVAFIPSLDFIVFGRNKISSQKKLSK